MDLSTEVDNRINELMSSVIQDDYDTIESPNRLLSEAVITLIDELRIRGIEVYEDIDQIVADQYHIKFIASLYRNYVPENIGRFLKDNIQICRCIGADATTPISEIFIVHLLEAVKDIYPNRFNIDMHNYLVDKIRSTQMYVDMVEPILQQVYNESFYTKQAIDKILEEEMTFLMKIKEERTWFSSVFTNLSYRKEFTYVDNRSLIPVYAVNFNASYVIPENFKLLAKYATLGEANQNVFMSLLNSIRQTSDFYVDRYTDEGLLSLSKEMLIAIILTQFSDKHLFGVEPNFERLKNIDTLPISDLIKLISTQG